MKGKCKRVFVLPETFKVLIGILDKQVHLDLSDFNDDKLSFSKFVENVKNGKLEIDFYNTLIYIEFPDLQASALNSKRDEAITILEWLNEKGVHNILSLNVPDSLQNPHRESDIVKTLQKFESVEFLNWRIQDMSLDTLKRIKGLKSLRLYSSGNRDVLKFWTSDEGLVNLEVRYFFPLHTQGILISVI